MLRREQEIRLSPEMQATYEEVEKRWDMDWMDATDRMQRRLVTVSSTYSSMREREREEGERRNVLSRVCASVAAVVFLPQPLSSLPPLLTMRSGRIRSGRRGGPRGAAMCPATLPGRPRSPRDPAVRPLQPRKGRTPCGRRRSSERASVYPGRSVTRDLFVARAPLR